MLRRSLRSLQGEVFGADAVPPGGALTEPRGGEGGEREAEWNDEQTETKTNDMATRDAHIMPSTTLGVVGGQSSGSETTQAAGRPYMSSS
jgi:hypothetical protein